MEQVNKTMMDLAEFIQLHPRDNCVVAVRGLAAGSILKLAHRPAVTVRQAIPPGHKVAIEAIDGDQEVIKYGWPIGRAISRIAEGEHIHGHNLRCEHKVDLESLATETPPPPAPIDGCTFEGFQRADGRVGTRNYIGVISTVNCSASVSRFVAQRFSKEDLRPFPHVDGIVAFRHDSGCGMAYDGIKHRTLARVLAGMAAHPNIGAYLLIGLGCEQNTIGHMMQEHRLVQIQPVGSQSKSLERPITISMQDVGGTTATIEKAVQSVAELLPRANSFRRQTVAASHLVLGTKCGGSDGYSGITANPALGLAVDRLVACGGTAILAETTELYGAEQLLTRSARSKAVAEKLLEKIEWWKWYAGIFGEEFDNNPSIGNKAGGLTTIIEKSLGAATKGGSTAMEAVYDYAEQVKAKGLVVMDTPGFDPVCVTGMVAGGANLVAFTTGRGSCFGCKPTPSLKIATNSALYDKMRDDMDLNTGSVLEGESLEAAGERIFQKLLEVASGESTKSELLGYGDDEFTPWAIGPTL